jgi:serine/threonine protein kinase
MFVGRLLHFAHTHVLTCLFPLKVADFGLSRAVLRGAGGGGGGGSGSTVPVDPAYGVTDSSRGPVAWMAPEQMEAHVYSQKSDVFMFGVCMFEMVRTCAV